jgi:hypothetical protein
MNHAFTIQKFRLLCINITLGPRTIHEKVTIQSLHRTQVERLKIGKIIWLKKRCLFLPIFAYFHLFLPILAYFRLF